MPHTSRHARVAILAVLAASTLSTGCKSSSGGGGGGGSLSFDKSSYAVTTGSTVALRLALSGSTDTSGVTATVTTSASGVAVPISAPCILSDEPGSTSSCTVQVKGLTNGTATLSATAPGATGASATVTVSAAQVPGTLAFSSTTESVTAGATTTINVTLDGSSGMPAQTVGIVSQNTSVATVSPTCTVSTAQPSCPVTIRGTAQGSAVITASAVGYPDTTTTATVTPGSVPGKLQFSGNVGVAVSEVTTATLSLVGSSNVSSFTATLSLGNANATISTTTCPLSSRYPTCSFNITGVTAGTDKISASASGYGPASMVANVGTTPQPGYLVFSATSESVAIGAVAKIQLSLGGSSGVSLLPVQVASTANASVLPVSCSLSSGGPPCPIDITGVTAGAATITASAAQYTNATNSVTVTTQPVVTYGQLQFSQLTPQVNVNSSVQMLLELVGSSNVDNLLVTLNNPAPSVASLSKTSCTLSTQDSTCSFQVTGLSQGSDSLSTSTSSPGPTVQAQATVTVGTALPTLSFNPSQLTLGLGDVASSPTTLVLSNLPTGVTYSVNLVPQYPLKPSPGTCTFPAPSASEVCNVNINQWSAQVPEGTYYFPVTATPSSADQPTLSAKLTVTVAKVTPVQRTIKVVNNCDQTVWAAISGGASGIPSSGSPPTCPAGTVLASTGDCFWANPVPSGGTSPDGYSLTKGQWTTFVISQAAMQTEWNNNDSGWNGNVMGRLNCDPATGACEIGSCNGGPSGTGLACVPGVSFNNPQTMAEFTFQTGQPDTYDITLINGVTIPTSMKVTGVTADTSNPFNNGEAGDVADQVGSNYTLPKSSWTFGPGSSDTTVPAATYNLLHETGLGGPCPGGTGCGSQQVCGYTLSALQQGSPSYQLMCGQRLGYLTAAAIWALNPNANAAAPFPFLQAFDTALSSTAPFPNTNQYPLWVFLQCPGPGSPGPYQLLSGYNSNDYPTTCGCSDWAGIAHEIGSCQSQNSAWMNQVLPKITWIKHGCPTCYSYQYDDASSTFSGLVNAPGNAANQANYTITFCPGETSIPPNDSP